VRHNFTAAAKREAEARAGGRCEATGIRYGLEPGVRCNADLSKTGIERDHYPRGAHDPHPETRTAANCVVCCPPCNQYAANHTDKKVEAKMKRLARKHGPVEGRKVKKPIPRPANGGWPAKGTVKFQKKPR
jgi:5-methylcytosine-specific restriction protein A